MAIAVQSVSLYHSIGTIVLLFHPIRWLFSQMGCYYGSKIIPSFFTIKEGSTSLLGLLPSGKKRKTALRCSEPLRYKVGGPSKVYAKLCGLGPPGVGILNCLLMNGGSSRLGWLYRSREEWTAACLFFEREQRIKEFGKYFFMMI